MSVPLVALLERVPGLAGETVVPIADGWDSHVHLVDGEWIVRAPRRPEVAARMRAEVALLAELGPALPVAVPLVEAIGPEGFGWLAYRWIEGEPIGPEADPRDVAAFLSALHRFPVERAAELGIQRPDWKAEIAELLEDFRRRVLPLLDAPEGALDFAWLLGGFGPRFGDELLAAYDGEVDAGFRDRARFYHLLGPWHEITYGLDRGLQTYVESGLAGVRERLR